MAAIALSPLTWQFCVLSTASEEIFLKFSVNEKQLMNIRVKLPLLDDEVIRRGIRLATRTEMEKAAINNL